QGEVVLLGGGGIGGEAGAEQQGPGAPRTDDVRGRGRLLAPPAVHDLAGGGVIALRDELLRPIERGRLGGGRRGEGETAREQERGDPHRAAGAAARASRRRSSSSRTCRSESAVDLSSRSARSRSSRAPSR